MNRHPAKEWLSASVDVRGIIYYIAKRQLIWHKHYQCPTNSDSHLSVVTQVGCYSVLRPHDKTPHLIFSLSSLPETVPSSLIFLPYWKREALYSHKSWAADSWRHHRSRRCQGRKWQQHEYEPVQWWPAALWCSSDQRDGPGLLVCLSPVWIKKIISY